MSAAKFSTDPAVLVVLLCDEVNELSRDLDEARAYLKAFLFATIDPEDKRADVHLHQANPSLGWFFTLNDTGMRGHREILGSQIRRAMEIVGFDKLKIEPAGTTVADDHVAACRRAQEAETTLAAQIAGHALTAKQSTENLMRATAAEKQRDALLAFVKSYAERPPILLTGAEAEWANEARVLVAEIEGQT